MYYHCFSSMVKRMIMRDNNYIRYDNCMRPSLYYLIERTFQPAFRPLVVQHLLPCPLEPADLLVEQHSLHLPSPPSDFDGVPQRALFLPRQRRVLALVEVVCGTVLALGVYEEIG